MKGSVPPDADALNGAEPGRKTRLERIEIPRDSRGGTLLDSWSAERAIYAAYDAAVQRDFSNLIGHADDDHKKQAFQKGLKEASAALKAAIDIAGLSETKVPEPKHASPSPSTSASESPSTSAPESPSTTASESSSTGQGGDE